MLRSKAVPGTPQTAVVAGLGVALGCQCVAASRRSVQRPARWGRILPSQNGPRRDAGALRGRWVLPLPHPHAPFSDEGCPGGGCSPGDASEKGFAVPAGRETTSAAGTARPGWQREEAEMGGNREKFYGTRQGAAAGPEGGGGFVFATKKTEASAVSAGTNARDAPRAPAHVRSIYITGGDRIRCSPTPLTTQGTSHLLKRSSSFACPLPPPSPAAARRDSPSGKRGTLGSGAVSAGASQRSGGLTSPTLITGSAESPRQPLWL